MNMPFFSLVVCTFRRDQELARLFQSLAAQEYQEFEVIVVDQNIDNRVEQYIDLARRHGLDVRWIRRTRPNLSAARNTGIQLARGRWIGFPDDDCWYEPLTLKRLHDSLPAQVPAIACLQWVEHQQRCPQGLSWSRAKRFRDPMVASFMLFFERSVFRTVGEFDTRLGVGQWFAAGEETDLVFRALNAGVAGVFNHSAIVHHPVKDFGAEPAGIRIVRGRARGVGAIYAIHKVPRYVIARGLCAPIAHALFKRRSLTGLAEGVAEVVGRLEGFVFWKMAAIIHKLQKYPQRFEDGAPVEGMTAQ